jgi:hypothetical protein
MFCLLSFPLQLVKDNPGAFLSLVHFNSTGSAIPHGTKQLSLFIVSKKYIQDWENIPRDEWDLRKIAAPDFDSWRKPVVVQQFENVFTFEFRVPMHYSSFLFRLFGST